MVRPRARSTCRRVWRTLHQLKLGRLPERQRANRSSTPPSNERVEPKAKLLAGVSEECDREGNRFRGGRDGKRAKAFTFEAAKGAWHVPIIRNQANFERPALAQNLARKTRVFAGRK